MGYVWGVGHMRDGELRSKCISWDTFECGYMRDGEHLRKTARCLS
jgi:hypothetical protein